MPLDADTIVDRRRLRRKLTFWRVLAFVVIILAVLGTVLVAGGRRGLLASTTGSIARLTIQGLIRGDTERVEFDRSPGPFIGQGGGRTHRQPRRHHCRVGAIA